ncbi:MAG: porin family protein, partial [Bacteroidales bacterium]|nr:porin family protein [Bacteroidales bacterium]
MKRYILTAIIAIAAATTLSAQESRTQALINASLRNWEIELRGGYNIGGVSPLPLPEEIRKLDSFNPTVPLSIEADFTKRLGRDNRWGVQFGVKVENKNMTTKATVKNYSMEIIGDDGAKVAGRWTGGVQTAVRNSYLTFPVVGVYRVHPRTNLKAGVFFSWLFDGTFEGYVY